MLVDSFPCAVVDVDGSVIDLVSGKTSERAPSAQSCTDLHNVAGYDADDCVQSVFFWSPAPVAGSEESSWQSSLRQAAHCASPIHPEAAQTSTTMNDVDAFERFWMTVDDVGRL